MGKRGRPQRKQNTIKWDELKQEFMLNGTHRRVRSWLRDEKGWTEDQIAAGNTQDHIAGWSEQRAETKRKVLEDTIGQLREFERARVPKLMEGRDTILRSILMQLEIEAGRMDNNLAPTKKLAELREMWEMIRVELSLPTAVSDNRSSEADDDDPIDDYINEFSEGDTGGTQAADR